MYICSKLFEFAGYPTLGPTNGPSMHPSVNPTKAPTAITQSPSTFPSNRPTINSTRGVSKSTFSPSKSPSNEPTIEPTNNPLLAPSQNASANSPEQQLNSGQSELNTINVDTIILLSCAGVLSIVIIAVSLMCVRMNRTDKHVEGIAIDRVMSKKKEPPAVHMDDEQIVSSSVIEIDNMKQMAKLDDAKVIDEIEGNHGNDERQNAMIDAIVMDDNMDQKGEKDGEKEEGDDEQSYDSKLSDKYYPYQYVVNHRTSYYGVDDGDGNTVNVNDYKNWDHEDIYNWIMSLENAVFAKYADVLGKSLKEEKVKGTDLEVVNHSVIKRWGIKDFQPKLKLLNAIKSLANDEGK